MTFSEWLFFSFGMPGIVLAFGLLLAFIDELSVRRELKLQAHERGE